MQWGARLNRTQTAEYFRDGIHDASAEPWSRRHGRKHRAAGGCQPIGLDQLLESYARRDETVMTSALGAIIPSSTRRKL
jgi:hypothetical protein